MTESLQSIAKMIDHSLLHPTLTDQELIDGCLVAIKHQVASVCIKPYAVPLAKEILAGSEVKVGTVIGFPMGAARQLSSSKKPAWHWMTVRWSWTWWSISAKC